MVRYNRPAGGQCFADTPNLTQIGRFGPRSAQAKIQLTSCATSTTQVMMECRFAGGMAAPASDEVVSTLPLVNAAEYHVSCVKSPDTSGKTTVTLKVTRIPAGQTVTTTATEPAMGALKTREYVSAGNKYPLPAPAANTSQFWRHVQDRLLRGHDGRGQRLPGGPPAVEVTAHHPPVGQLHRPPYGVPQVLPTLPPQSGRGRGQFQLDTVRIFEREHVNAKRCECGDLAVRDPALIEQPQRVLEVLAAGDAKTEMVKADPVRVETIARFRHRPQTHDQVAAGHDHTAEEDLERLGS